VLGDPLAEHAGVDGRRQRHERGAEAGAEGSGGFGDAALGAGLPVARSKPTFSRMVPNMRVVA
jgi:hypothetical protein